MKTIYYKIDFAVDTEAETLVLSSAEQLAH